VPTATQTLHRLTSYAPPSDDWDKPADDPRIVQDLATNDIERLPWFYKRYAEGLPRVALPRELPSTEASAVEVLAGAAAVPERELDLVQLSRLLHLAAGVVRTTTRPYAVWLFRAAGSAGARFPIELYVSVPETTTLPAGVHWYDPSDHALVRIAPPPSGGAVTVVSTGVPWRTGWRYRERGFRHVYWDSGTMLSQLLAAAVSAGIESRIYTRFPDEQVSALVGADGVHEWPVAVVALGGVPPALEPSGAAATGEVDADPLEFPLVTEAQRAGDRDDLGEPWQPGAPVEVPLSEALPVETAVLTRSSQRRMNASRGLPGDVLRTAFAAATRGIDVPHRVVVNDVDGFEPGVYRWPELARGGNFREELYRVALDQGLPRDAAFVVIGTADVSKLDDREYREAQLAAGLVEGRLHLLAYALGASASGMTFLDTEVPGLLGEQADTLLFTCVGVPEYAPRRGGLPGAPEEFRQVTPRIG
jgi:SagB-type dehydrogenase family enzyme